jgi:hypothetical protein
VERDLAIDATQTLQIARKQTRDRASVAVVLSPAIRACQQDASVPSANEVLAGVGAIPSGCSNRPLTLLDKVRYGLRRKL